MGGLAVVRYIIIAIICYFIGSISSSYIIGRIGSNIDIRQYGSGNLGATNTLRVLGLKAGIGVLLADFLKGMAATFIGLGIGGEIGGMIGGMAAILGHNWPIFLEFRGGKGIATSLGLIFTLFPRIGVILVILGVIIIILTRYVSLASLIGSIIFPILISIFNYDLVYIIGSIVISGLAIYRHRSNISRLLKGKENKISFNLKSR